MRSGQSGLADGGSGSLTLISDPDPVGDVCSATTHMLVSMAGNNIGDLLNNANISWGWFSGGFDLTIKNQNGTTSCQRSSKSPVSGKTIPDYMPRRAAEPQPKKRGVS